MKIHDSYFTTEDIVPRELGVLEFNRRVLELAEESTIPVLERLRYICIISNNLDEFFEVLVARLKTENNQNKTEKSQKISALLDEISAKSLELVNKQYDILNNQIIPDLEKHNIFIKQKGNLNKEQTKWISKYFKNEVNPVLTPIGIDPAHPFPRVLNKSLNFAVQLEGKDAFKRKVEIAIVQVPRSLPRVIELPSNISDGTRSFITISSIVQNHIESVFPGVKVIGAYQFRVTRNSELFVDEEEVTDLRDALKGELSYRQYGASVRLETSKLCPQKVFKFLLSHLDLETEDLFLVDGPVNLVRLMSLPKLVKEPDLEFPRFVPGIPDHLKKYENIFDAIDEKDILLHHPYQSFSPVIDFLESASNDPTVVAIKQTVYRTGVDSAVMKKLINAAQKGKQVTVALELFARFDEETNYDWARRLEDAGVTVVYGVVGFKTHAKMLLVLRKLNKKLRYYCHLGTGNYNADTARRYTDLGLLTSNQELGKDINGVFSQLTGVGQNTLQKRLWVAPFNLKSLIIESIEKEIKIASKGRVAKIFAKINALTDEEIINKLYVASKAGVKIDLIIRGACGLRPGIEGLSENISVRSILGQFLEHSRVIMFFNNGKKDLYIGSADWMTRNLHQRVEVCFPITDAKLKTRIIDETINADIKDDSKAWKLKPNHTYERIQKKKEHFFSAQSYNLEKMTK